LLAAVGVLQRYCNKDSTNRNTQKMAGSEQIATG